MQQGYSMLVDLYQFVYICYWMFDDKISIIFAWEILLHTCEYVMWSSKIESELAGIYF